MRKTIYLLPFIFLIIISITYAVNLKDGLVFYYNGSSDFKDSSKTRTTGTNFQTIDTLGILDRARYGDGSNDYISWPDSNDFDQTSKISISFWLNISATTDGEYIIGDDGWAIRTETDGSHGGCTAGNKLAFVIVGKATVCDNSDTFTVGTYEHWVFIKNSSGVTYYKNGIKGEFDTETNTMTASTGLFYLFRDVAGGSYVNGKLDSIAIYNKSISSEVITSLNYGGQDCNPIINPSGCTAGDTTPPVISNINQIPSNTTVINLAEQGLNISTTISDNVEVRNASIHFQLNNTQVFINGTYINYNITYDPTLNSSTYYEFVFDETHFLGASYPINPDDLIGLNVYNFTFQGTNKILKYRFMNISGKIRASFVEDMANNISGTEGFSSYYYCNSTYTTGNPSVSPYCSLFGSISNKANYHSHDGIFHRQIPMSINTTTEKIGNTKITPISYILKTGTSAGEYVYYHNVISRYDFAQLSNNLGNTYSNLAYTPIVHIHQIDDNANINYRICADDKSNNSACSSWINSQVYILELPPNAVIFSSPITAESYNGSIDIRHTDSISPQGNPIIYSYYYSSDGTYTFITNLTEAEHNTYTWDISNIENGVYNLKLIITDQINGLQTIEFIEGFIINNPLPLDIQILTDIRSELEDLNGGINMIAVVLFYSMITFISYWLLFKGEYWIGLGLNFFSWGFDLALLVWLYDKFISNTTYTGWKLSFVYIFGVTMILWVLSKFLSPFIIKAKFKKII